MPTVLVTGANRGIGLGFARHYAAAGWDVLAACRTPEEAVALKRLPNTSLLRLDMTDEAGIAALARGMAGRPLDLLINNAGMLGPRSLPLGTSQQAEWLSVLSTNAVGPYLLAERLASNVLASQGKRVVNASSSMASLSRGSTDWAPIYAVSKAALNMVTRHLAAELGPRGGIVVALSPGWVQTAMGGPGAVTPVDEAVAALAATIEGLTPTENGSFLDSSGSPFPW